MVLLPFVWAALAMSEPSIACPKQPEPAPLTTAAFKVPRSGETLLFSAAPSFRSVRYALRIVRPHGAGPATASLLRLSRRFDCNLHDRAGQWTFSLSQTEADAVFEALPAQKELAEDAQSITTDGTRIELKHYARGKLGLSYASNGPAMTKLSTAVLKALGRHVPATELPRSADWHFKLPGSPL